MSTTSHQTSAETVVPQRFNLARYCLAAGGPRRAQRDGLVVVRDLSAPFERHTFAELDAAVRAIAAGLLGAGLTPGERVVLRMGNTSQGALLFFGAIAAGLIAVPTSDLLTPDEFRYIVEDADPAVVAIHPDLALELAQHPARLLVSPSEVDGWCADLAGQGDYANTAADDPAFLVYTSGTTSAPKGVLHAQRSAWGRRPMYQGWYGITSDDVMLHAAAMNWTYTLGVGLTDPWANGATAVVYAGPKDAHIWPRLIEASGATLFAAVPGIYRRLLASLTADDRHDIASARGPLATLRHGLVAGEALPVALLQEWEQTTGKPLLEALGMSEISTFISQRPGRPARPGSPGMAQPGRTIAVLDDAGNPVPRGEIGTLAVHRRDPGLFLTYWNHREPQHLQGDWFRTGDLVHLAEDGYVIHHGRGDDVMTSMGYRVSPAEVEACLSAHRGVAEAGVVERQVSDGVRIIVAFVVPTAEADCAALPQQVLAHAREHLARYKCPREVILTDTLPRTGNGKLQRPLLRRRLAS